MAYKIQLKRDLLANWEKYDPILADGEIGLVTDSNDPKKYTKLKIGNGSSKFSELPWFTQSGTNDYLELENKPSINDITLQGNLSLADLNIQEKGDYTTLEEVINKINESIEKSLENYYTKDEIGSQLETKQDTLKSGENISTINGQSLLNGNDIVIDSGTKDYSELTNKPSINNVELTSNKSLSDLGIQEKGDYVTNSDLTDKLSSKADKTEIPTKVSELENDIEYQTKTQLDEAINQKQDILVSGTNIKTINGETILGEGDIEIQVSGSVDSKLDENSENPVQNKVLTPLINQLMDKVFPYSFSVTGGAISYWADAPIGIVNVKWALKKGSDSIYPDTITVNGTEVDHTSSGTTFASVEADTNYNVVATKDGKTFSGTAYVRFYNYHYFGLVDSDVTIDTITSEQIVGLGVASPSSVQTTKSFTKEIDLFTNKKYLYAYPKSYGTLTYIKDANGFDYISSYDSTIITINDIEYYVYILQNATTQDKDKPKQIYG